MRSRAREMLRPMRMIKKAVNTVPKVKGLPLKVKCVNFQLTMDAIFSSETTYKPHIWTILFQWFISVFDSIKDTSLPHFFNVVIKHIRKRRILLVAECKRLEIILSWGCNHFA